MSQLANMFYGPILLHLGNSQMAGLNVYVNEAVSDLKLTMPTQTFTSVTLLVKTLDANRLAAKAHNTLGPHAKVPPGP